MGRLSQYRNADTFRFHLPEPFSGEWIECPQEVPVARLAALLELGDNPNPAGLAAMLAVMSRLVTGWSFTDDDDVPLPVTQETLGDLPQDLWAAIIEAYLGGLARLNPKALGGAASPSLTE